MQGGMGGGKPMAVSRTSLTLQGWCAHLNGTGIAGLQLPGTNPRRASFRAGSSLASPRLVALPQPRFAHHTSSNRVSPPATARCRPDDAYGPTWTGHPSSSQTSSDARNSLAVPPG